MAGCLGPSPAFEAEGGRPLLVPGYAYDGRGVRPIEGAFMAKLDPTKNRGTLRANFTDAAHSYRVEWAGFLGAQSYESGGVAANQFLFGATGNGSSDFPRVFAYVAAFGPARFYQDDQLQRDPRSLNETFAGLFFTSRGQFRDPDTFKVTKADRSTPYDPASPADAFVRTLGSQASLVLTTSRGDVYVHAEFREVRITRLAAS